MFRLFELFGKSAALNALEDALRTSGIHPLLVPDAVKLTLVKLCKEASASRGQDAVFADAAQLLAFCMLGRETFTETNTTSDADEAEHRLQAAIETGDSLDAKLILLALHSGVAAPEITDQIDLDAL